MSLHSEAIWAAQPSTTRGSPTPLSADAKGERIAYASNKSIFVRSIDNPANSRQYTAHTVQTTVARFSPSGFYVASGDVSGSVRVWDAVGEDMVTKGEYHIIAGRINDIAWDGDSQRIIAVGDGKERFGHCITADSGNSVGEISGHSSPINSVSIRQQRPLRAATASDDTSLVFYHGAPFKFNTSIRGKHSKFVYGTQFSPDGALLVSVGSDRTIQLYDGKTGEWQKSIGAEEHKGSILGVSWAKDSKRFVTCSADQTVKVWNAESGKCEQSWRLGPEGGLSVSHQQVGVVWPHGRSDDLIISLDLDGNLSYLKFGDTNPVKIITGHQKNVTALSAGPSNSLWTGSSDGRIRGWDVPKAEAFLLDGESHTNYVAALVEAPPSRVLSVGWDDTLRVIDASAKTFAGTGPSKLAGQPCGIAYNAKTARTDVATPQGIEVFDKDGKLCGTVPFTSHNVTCIAVGPDSKFIAVGTNNKAVHVLTPGSKLGGVFDEVTVLTDSLKSNPSALSFSNSSSHLAIGTASGPIVVYSTADWSVTTSRWAAHTSRVNSISWSPDDRSAISGSLDTNVHVWSLLEPGKRIKASNAHKDGVSGVVWSAESNRCFSAGADATVKVWSVKGL